MAVIELSKDVIGLFDYISGNTTTEKIVNLMDADLTQKLHECEDEIYRFEVKYRMSFKGGDWGQTLITEFTQV